MRRAAPRSRGGRRAAWDTLVPPLGTFTPCATGTQMCRFNSQSCRTGLSKGRARWVPRCPALEGHPQVSACPEWPCFPPQPRLLRLASNAPVLHRRKHNPGESRSLRFDTGQCLSRWGWEPPTAAHAADDPAAGRRKLSSM